MTSAAPSTAKRGRPSTAERAARAGLLSADELDAVSPTPGARGGARANSGRKSAAVEAGSADAHILYAKARAKKEAFLAQMAELDFKVKAGEYLPRDEIRQASATAFATIAQTLRSIPDNLERRLGVSADVAEEVGRLIDDAMADLAADLERMHEA